MLLTPKTKVRFKRDFPRLGMRIGDEAEVTAEKGVDPADGQRIHEITFYSPAERKQVYLVVLEEWVEG
jgi:hypothetical protein